MNAGIPSWRKWEQRTSLFIFVYFFWWLSFRRSSFRQGCCKMRFLTGKFVPLSQTGCLCATDTCWTRPRSRHVNVCQQLRLWSGNIPWASPQPWPAMHALLKKKATLLPCGACMVSTKRSCWARGDVGLQPPPGGLGWSGEGSELWALAVKRKQVWSCDIFLCLWPSGREHQGRCKAFRCSRARGHFHTLPNMHPFSVYLPGAAVGALSFKMKPQLVTTVFQTTDCHIFVLSFVKLVFHWFSQGTHRLELLSSNV